MRVILRHISRHGRVILPALGLCMVLGGCGNRNSVTQETPTSGVLHISIDESFRPVIDSQIKVFESSYPDVKIIADYKPEADCFRDLTTDSTRMVIVTKGLSHNEEKFFIDSFHLTPAVGILALDAVAVIVNNNSKDSIFSMKDIHAMLDGSDTKHQVVMDGRSATSTVRYAMDSVLKGQPLGKNVQAAKSSEDVINFVANNPQAVGFIGVSWIGDQEDPSNLTFLKKVNIAAIRCESCLAGTYVKPYQANIALRRYPMVRSLYYILKENYSGVGNNFVNFLEFERGQLIFRRSYLVPWKMSFEIRNMQISN
jgi:phosphate transport system substrate-binding protein